MLSAFSVKIWPGLASKEYSINTNLLLQVHELGPIYLGEFCQCRELPHDCQEGLRADTCGGVCNEERQESRRVFLCGSKDVVPVEYD